MMSSSEVMSSIKERRILCPNIIQQLWPTIIHIKKLKQMPTLEKLQAHMYKKFHMTSNDCEKHVNNAVKDGLLITTRVVVADQSGKEVTIYTSPEKDVTRDGHDWYCFECHRPGKVIECELCWRVYHIFCTDFSADSDQPFICTVCLLLQKDTERMVGNKVVTLHELNQLLSYIYERLVGDGTEPFHLPNNEEEDYKLRQLVYNKIDLSLMFDKTKKNAYKKLVEFHIDCQNIVHCVSVLNGSNSVNANLAQKTFKDCNNELTEVKQCVDCYRMSSQKQDKLWFCRPCNPPHELVYAKQKGFPYWPAKVIKIENGIYDVKFFGSFHERSFIESDCVKPISLTLTQLRITKRSPQLNKALMELKSYQKLLEELTNQSINQSPSHLTSPSHLRNVSLKRPRRRADGTRPRKKSVKIKEELTDTETTFETALNGMTASTPNGNHHIRQLTSTPRTFVKSPIRTRNRGVRNPCKSLETSVKAIKNKKMTKRKTRTNINTSQTQSELMSNFFENTSELPLTTTTALVDSVLLPSEKLVKAKKRSNRLLNGIGNEMENDFSNSSYESETTTKSKRLKTITEGKNGESSLARTRPVRQSKPNSRYKSPEMVVKLPKRKFRQQNIVIKKEPIEVTTPLATPLTTPLIIDNKLNQYEFTDETQVISNISTNPKKRHGIKSRRKSLQSNKSMPSSIDSQVSSVEMPANPISIVPEVQIPVQIPKVRGRPKGCKNKTIKNSVKQDVVNTCQSPPKLLLPNEFNTSGNCNCETKLKKTLKKLTESLEAKHKMELMKLKKDLEAVKKLNYRLQNQNSSFAKEIEQFKAESHSFDKQKLISLEQKHQKEVSLMKKKQWCFNCEAEAIYFCCWNTSYCSLDCQQQHWHSEHKRTCRRVKR